MAKYSHNKLRVLFIQQEYDWWWTACKWAYSQHLGIEEGLSANSIDFFTITTHWLRLAEKLCAKKQFDQVWINDIVHLNADERFMQWVSTIAPIRVGLLVDAVYYTPEEYDIYPGLKIRQHGIEMRLKYVTHIVAVDDKEVDTFNSSGKFLAMWSPAAIPRRFILNTSNWNPDKPAVFSGSLYFGRKQWLEYPELKTLLVYSSSPEKRTGYPFLFNLLPIAIRGSKKLKVRTPRIINLSTYLYLLRLVRRRTFMKYLRNLQNYSAVVNLPSFFKGYVAHVFEGMAAARPVISWRLSNRPKWDALFKEDEEILLFDKDNPQQLVEQIRRVKSQPKLAHQLISNARERLLCFHTMEKRVQQIIEWIETGKVPKYD